MPAIARYRDRLRADLMIILDGPGHSSGRPTVAFGARGIVTFDLTVFGPRAGVHSGNYGNWIPNPAMRLAALLASMKADDGRVTVAGFYDGVVAPGPPRSARCSTRFPRTPSACCGTFGVAAPERAFPKLQDALQSPTLNVRGLVASHVGAGRPHDHPRPRDRRDGHPAGEGDAGRTISSTRCGRTSGARATTWWTASRTTRRAPRIRRSRGSTPARRSCTRSARRRPIRGARALVAAIDADVRRRRPSSSGRWAARSRSPRFIDALGFPAVLVPIVNFDNNQHEENENVRLGSLFDAIVTLAAVLRM